jgi:hypothetical protein
MASGHQAELLNRRLIGLNSEIGVTGSSVKRNHGERGRKLVKLMLDAHLLSLLKYSEIVTSGAESISEATKLRALREAPGPSLAA